MRRPLTYLFALFIAAFLPPAARAGFTYEDLVELIKGKNLQSVEEVTAALPADLQSHITFRLKPQNRIQKGTRAIRFTPDGRLVIAHGDDPKKPGGRSLEIIEVTISGKIQLHEISFPESKGAPVISSDFGSREKEHLQSCLACHGDPARMIWPAYNDWPHSCGAKDDSADEECLAFLKSAKKNPRFKDLKWDPANPAWPYYANKKARAMKRMPNTRFTAMVSFHNSRQVANVVQSSPLYPQLQYNLIRQNRCINSPAPAALKDRLKNLLMRDSAIVPPANFSGTSAQYVEKIFANRESPEYSSADVSSVKFFYDKQNTLTYLEFFGIPEGNTGGTEVITKAGRTGMAFTGQEFGGDTTSLAIVQLMNDLAKTDAKLKKLVEKRVMNFSEALAPSPYYDSKTFNEELHPSFVKEYEGRFSKVVGFDKDLCAYLTTKANEELDAYEKLLDAWLKDSERPVANVPLQEDLQAIREIHQALKADKLKAGRLILQHEKCVACHDPASGKAVGPHFPFRDAIKARKSLVRRVGKVVAPEASLKKRMPLNRPPLSAEEREAVMLYLKSIVE